MSILRAYAYKLKHNLTESAFADLPHVFPSERLPSLHKIQARVAFLSGLAPQHFDCCIESCMAYTGPLSDLLECPHCGTSRHDEHGKPRRQFSYVSIIPRLSALYRDPTTAEKMAYRADFDAEPGVVKDVFDSSHYRSLCGQEVKLGGQCTGRMFFSDRRDIALGLSTDGFSPWRRRKKSAWPIILYNYNLPPDIRFHKDNIIPLCVIPGPKKPKDFDSFLWPALQEFLKLSIGVPAFDALTVSQFLLCAFLIIVSGDIPAVSMVMQMKGHNAIVPCRMCKIRALRDPDSRAKTHYVPLERSQHPGVKKDPNAIKSYNPAKLPLRNHKEFLEDGRAVMAAATNNASEQLARDSGVKGVPLLSYLPSLAFPISFPYDFMHLIWENLIPNLIAHWTGNFKGLDQGAGSYELSASVWDAVGKATSEAGNTIPSTFGPRLGNIAEDRSACTADAWSLWTLYISPVLLRQRFTHIRYYNHFVELIQLLHLCLQFDITEEDIAKIRRGFIDWVEKYER